MATIERTIIIPNADNDGRSLADEQAAFEAQLLDIAGGFTCQDVTGAWRDETGRVYHDASKQYTICCDAEQDARIVASLPDWCARCKQEALFTAARLLDVQFITARPLAA